MRVCNGRSVRSVGLLLVLGLVAVTAATAAPAAPLKMPLREGQVWRIYGADGAEAARIVVARLLSDGTASWCTEDPATFKLGAVKTVPVAELRVAILDELFSKGVKADYGFFMNSMRYSFAPAGSLSLASMAEAFAETLPPAPDEPKHGPKRVAARLKAAKDLPARLEAWVSDGIGVVDGKPSLKEKAAAWAGTLSTGTPAAGGGAPAAAAGGEGGAPGAKGGPAGGEKGAAAPAAGDAAPKKGLPLVPIGGGVVAVVVVVAVILMMKKKRG